MVINGFGEPAKIEETRAGIEREFGRACHYSNADMTKPDAVAAMIAEAEARFGAVDILVNNAGVQFVAPVEEFPVEKWDQILAINLSSAFHTIRAAVPGMKRPRLGPPSSTSPRRTPTSPRPTSRPTWRPSTASPA